MAQRNMLCTRQLHDLEIEQGQTHLHPEPCILVSNIIDFPNQIIHPSMAASVNASSLDSHHLSDHDSSGFYGNQYNPLQQRHPLANLELGGAGPSNLSYGHYIVPSSSRRMCPVALNHGSSDHMASSSNHGILGVGAEGYGSDNHFMDYVRGSCKRKNSEGVLENYYHANGPSGSSSSSLGILPNTGVQQWEEPFEAGVGVMDTPVFAPPEYRINGAISNSDASQRSVRSRSSTIGLAVEPTGLSHHHNQMLQGNFMSRSFQPASNAWVEQFGNNGGDMSNSSWNNTPATQYFNGRSISGVPFEVGSTSAHGYQDALPGRISMNLLHPSSMHHYHHHPPPMQAMRGGQGYSYHPQLPTSSYRHPIYGNMHHGAMNPSRDVLESGSRYPRTFPSTGDRIYRSHRRASQTVDETSGRMRVLSSEETWGLMNASLCYASPSENCAALVSDVAMLEFSGFYGVDDLADQHRDMRLDIDDMSYEELLALQELIGVVNTGLSEDFIWKCLKTKKYTSHAAPRICQSTDMMQDSESCIICQVEYEDGETIGMLDCRHDYHADCIRKWLMVKNICPICKTSALSMDMKH
ncbi:hypothetical protein ACLOJK_010411 [Asimina triloba]